VRFGPATRKAILIVHVVVSVGWIGAVIAFAVLDAATLRSDPTTVRAAYIGMDLLTTMAIVPLAFSSLLTGIVTALGTPWGLFRHWWVLMSLALTLIAVIVLLGQVATISERATQARDPAATDA